MAKKSKVVKSPVYTAQLFLDGFKSIMFTPRTSFERVQTLTYEEGMYLIKNFKKVNSLEIEGLGEPQSPRIKLFKRGETTCVSCGTKGHHFYIERHKNDQRGLFSLNLYGIKNGHEVMMTWDHIIPKSLGGSNSRWNAQCMCNECNSNKGNVLSLSEMVKIGTSEHAPEMFRDINLHPVKKNKERNITQLIDVARSLLNTLYLNHNWRNA